MTDRTKACAWHQCRAPFEPKNNRQDYCSPRCRKAREMWCQTRGRPLVDILLSGDAEALVAARNNLRKEIENAK
jgi:hypothetical protein